MKDARIKPPRPARLSAKVLLSRWIVRGRMTQAEAAEQIGISRVKLNQYLNAEARPSLETAIRIEDTTGVAMRAWLIEEVTGSSSSGAPGAGSERAGETPEGEVTEVNITPPTCGKLG